MIKIVIGDQRVFHIDNRVQWNETRERALALWGLP